MMPDIRSVETDDSRLPVRGTLSRTALAALLLAAASCGQLLGIEPWDPEVTGAGGGSVGSGSGASSGPGTGAGPGSGGETSVGSSATTSTTAGAGGDGGSPSSSSAADGGGGAASSSSTGPCGDLEDCMGTCIDCFGGACVAGEPRCQPVLFGTADAAAGEAFVAIGTTRIWYGRSTEIYALPTEGPGGAAPLATDVSGAVSGLAVLGAVAIGAHAGGIVRLSTSADPVTLFTAPAATVSGVAVGDGKVWFGGDWSGIDGIYGIDDTEPTLAAIPAQCTNPGGAPRAVAYVDHDLYLATDNVSAIGGGFYTCRDSDAAGTAMTGEELGLSVHRIARTSFGDFAAAVLHEVVPELARFDDSAALIAGPVLESARVYDLAGGDDVLFFTLDAPLGGLTVDGVYAIALPGGDVADVVRVATCTGKCEAVAVDDTRLVYSQADGGVWSLQLDGTPLPD
jgi:hypothetical protein